MKAILSRALVMISTAALALVAAPASAETKIGFVNSQKVVNEAPQSARAKKRIEKDFEKRDQDLQKIAKDLQVQQEALEKNAMTMSESERRTKEREFNEMSRDFQRKQREFREDLSQRQNEEMAAIFDRVNKVIRQIAESEKYDIIFQDAVYANPRIDITDKVLGILKDAK
jgi:outer membrane protein